MPSKLPPPFLVGETYVDRGGEYVVIAVEHDEIVFKRSDGREERAKIQVKANIHRNIIMETAVRSQSNNSHGSRLDSRSVKGGILEEMYGFIAEIIEEHSRTNADYILHDSVTEALTNHKSAGPLLKQRSERELGEKSIVWFASDYLVFYSKEWTEGRPRYADRFERKKIQGKWAYRVRHS